MKAVVWHGYGDIRLDTVAEPKVEQPTDAIVRVTTSAICGTDLHMVRGTLSGMEPGRILGHEAVGVVEQVGAGVRNLRPGDRVIVPSTIACGYCSYCRAGYYAQCDVAAPPNGTAFFGGPQSAGGYDGLQAEYARVPFANVGLVPVPDEVSDDDAILISDIFPTGWQAARMADVHRGDTVAVLGCGPVGQFAIASAQLQGAGRVIAVDGIADRLEMARNQNAEVVDFNVEHPAEVIKELTGGIGVDRIIDAVGVDAERPKSGPAAEEASQQRDEFDRERAQVAPDAAPQGQLWKPGDAPSMALQWAVQAVAKAGTVSIIGVYPPTMTRFPIGQAMMHNLTVKMGNCNHRKYIPMLVEYARSGRARPGRLLTQKEPLTGAVEAFTTFDRRPAGWTKVALEAG
jgi:threonine dehydrogenase-like Zn-dependent dehydrogenase